MVILNDFGVHQSLKSSGLVQASNTRRAGALKVRVTTTSRSDVRSTFVALFPLFAFIALFLLFEAFKDSVQFGETRRPHLLISRDPRRLLFQPAPSEPAGADAPDFLGDDEPRRFQNADMLFHAGERHMEFFGQIRDRGVGAAELL